MKRIIAIALLATLLLAGCGETPEPTVTAPSLYQPELEPPELVPVTVGTFYNYGTSSATVAPYTQTLSFAISGRIGKSYIYPGKEVKAGELLAELEHSSLSSRIASLEASIADTSKAAAYTDRMDQLQIDILKVELKQLEDQLAAAEEGDISRLKQQIALKKNDVAQAEADLRQEQALRNANLAIQQEELEKLREELEAYFLYAPISGRIAYDTPLVAGYPVSQSTPVVAISDDSRMVLDVYGYFSEEVEAAALSISARIGDTDYAIQRIPPTEQEIIYAAQNDTHPDSLFEILGTEEELAKLSFGQYASIGVVSCHEENALLIPVTTIHTTPAGSYYVYVDENGQRVKRDIEIGAYNSISAWVTDGLEEGENLYYVQTE